MARGKSKDTTTVEVGAQSTVETPIDVASSFTSSSVSDKIDEIVEDVKDVVDEVKDVVDEVAELAKDVSDLVSEVVDEVKEKVAEFFHPDFPTPEQRVRMSGLPPV